MDDRRKDLLRALAEFGLSCAVYWYLTRSPSDPPLGAVVYRKTAQLAQAGAHQLGQLGLRAERAYYQAVSR